MRKIDVRGQAAIAFDHAKALALRLKHLQMSPLSAMLLAGLSAVALITGLFALYAILGPTGVDDGPAAPEWKPPTLAIVPLEPPKPANVDVEALSRPIFSKSRKPSPKAAAAPSETNLSAAPGTMSVTAIVRDKNTSRAFLISSDAPEGAWRKIGDTVENWTVTAIAPREVILRSGDQSAKLPLYGDPAVAADAAATVIPPPPPLPPPPPSPLQPQSNPPLEPDDAPKTRPKLLR
jgi:hypothetical protein